MLGSATSSPPASTPISEAHLATLPRLRARMSFSGHLDWGTQPEMGPSISLRDPSEFPGALRTLPLSGDNLLWTILTTMFLAASVLCSCDRYSDSARVLLKEAQTQWVQDVTDLRRQEGELHQRLDRLSVLRSPGLSGPQVIGVTIAPLLKGTRQAIAAVEVQGRQASAKLAPELEQGGKGALEAVERERNRMTRSIQMLKEQLALADRQLIKIEHP